MRKTTVWLSVLMLALASLSCVKDPVPPVHHHGDPDPIVVEGEKPYCTILVGDDYLSNGQVVETDVEYHYGFRVISNPTTQQDLARFVVTINGDIWCDTAISGKEYCYESTIRFVVTREIVGSAEIFGTVTDVAGEYNSISITVDVSTPDPPVAGEVQSLPYRQLFASDFGTYTTYDVEGPQVWEIEYSTAKIAGYVGTYYANEDWLISSPVDLSGVSDAKMIIVYIGRYFNNINQELTIWASTNYVWGTAPSTASWTQVPASLVEGSNWNDFLTAEIALTDFVGQTVTFAVKYISTDQKAGTIEIQSITIEEGTGVTPTPPPTPGISEGSGTVDDPYNVAAGIENQGQDITAWVRGYIVGAVKSGVSGYVSNEDINWSAPFDCPTNVVIADDADCKEISQCVIVNLPNGKPLREQVNLVDHPENLGKCLAVYGTLRAYFGQAGLRDSEGTEAFFVLEGGTPTPPPSTNIFSETFVNGQGSFVIQDVVLPADMTYIWNHDSNYGFMKASGYVNGYGHVTESWLVSPAINLTGTSAPSLSFEQAVNYYSPPTDFLSVMISTDYNGDVTTASWTELNLDQWPVGNDWILILSTADLTPFVGQTINIAFKYSSSDSTNPTWEVKNFLIEGY